MTANEIEALRHLLYPLGFLSAFAFSTRFLIQWWQSEKEGHTVVPRIFWVLSITGNSLLAAHSFIQLHFPVYFIQLLQATLAWRNLDLMKGRSKSLSKMLLLLLSVALLSTLLFLSQKWLLPQAEFLWVRSPQKITVSPFFHLVGCCGVGAISIRFWVQWWEAENARKSILPAVFWWLSLGGMVLSAIYFVSLNDWVNAFGPVCSIIPYARNLYLVGKEKKPLRCDIALVAGETSGDLIGKEVALELRLRNPNVRLAGIAGQEMRKSGVEAWLKAESFQVMGLFDVLKRLFFLYRSIRFLTHKLVQTNPQAVLFIDQPSFSLAVAERLRKRGFTGKIIQIVAPTVWAYKKERVDAFAATFDHIMPLYRFECEYFQDKMPTTWVGHPVLEAIKKEMTAKDFPKKYLVLFPGSRESEIKKNFPLQLKAAAFIVKGSGLIPTVVIPDMIPKKARKKVEDQLLALFPHGKIIPFEQRYRLMSEAKAALTKSGTVTLELALSNVPFACCFQTGIFTRFWLKTICRLETSLFALPNIISKKMIFPEHILPPVTPENIARDLEPYITGKIAFPQAVREAILLDIDSGESCRKRVVDAVERTIK